MSSGGSLRSPRSLRGLVLLTALLFLPLPALPVGAINANTTLTQFFNCTNTILWQNCPTGNFSDSFNVTKTGITTNEEATGYGFRMPAQGVAASAEFDLEALHGYRWRNQLHQSQGAWGLNSVFNNTTAQFGLRTDLDGSSPFFAPRTSDLNVSFNTALTNYDTVAGDFDGDGGDELAVLVGPSPNSAVQIRKFSGGNWLNYSSYPLSLGTPFQVKAADLNLDGKLDLLAIAYTASPYLYPLIQLPGGVFRPEGPIQLAGGVPNDFAVGDLSGDGYPDAAVVYGNRSAYWFNEYTGRNLDLWGANDYSIKAQSGLFPNRATSLLISPFACTGMNLVAQANFNNYVYIQNQTTLATVATLTAHTGVVNGIAWSPNCAYFASASTDRTVLVWYTANWTVAANLTEHSNSVYAVAFSPDSSLIATGGADANLRVWNLTAFPPALDWNVSDSNGTIYALAFSPNGSVLAGGTGSRTVRMRSTADYSLIGNLSNHSLAVRTLAYSPDGISLVSGSDDDRMVVWDAANLTKSLERTPFTADVARVGFSPNGSMLIAASLDGRVRTFLVSDWSLYDDVVEGSQFVYGADFDRTGQFLITGGTDARIRVWNKAVLTSLSRMRTPQEFSVMGVAFSTGGLLASASEDGTVYVQLAQTGAAVTTLSAHQGSANAVAFSPEGGSLATAGSDGQVRVWNTSTWAYTNLTDTGNVTSVDFSPSGLYLAASNASGGIIVWLTSNLSFVQNMTAPAAVFSVAFDPTGLYLVSGGADNIVRIWESLTGWNFQNLTTGVSGPTIRAVDWSPDGNQVAAGGTERRLRLWWTSNWTLMANVLQHTNDIMGVGYSPDSVKVASAGRDARIYTYTQGGTLLQNYSAPGAGFTQILTIGWSKDGRRIAAGWYDSRYPTFNFALCTCGSLTTLGIAIGPADNTAGNDIVIVGRSGTSSSGAWRLPFSGGSGTVFTTMLGGVNPVQGAVRVAFGDLSGDGRPDLAVAAETQPTGATYLIWWNTSSNNWDGQSGNVVSIPSGGSVNEILIADVTDDGHNDVITAAGSSTNQVDVLYYEEYARQTGAFRMSNVSRAAAANIGDTPMGIAVGRFNNDSLTDVAAANGPNLTVQIYLQKDELYATYISGPIQDAQLGGNPVVAASLYWDDWNVVANLTDLSAYLTIDGGFTWHPVVENQTVNFTGPPSAYLQYRVDFHATRAAITAWILAIWIDYLLETTPINISLDVGRDFSPANGDCYYPGPTLGLQHCAFSPDVVNGYVQNNLNQQDANRTVYIPIRMKWERPATLRLTNLSIRYNSWPAPPQLFEPAAGSFSDATPTYNMSSLDVDQDNLRYQVQVSGDASFTSVAHEYDQNTSSSCWGLPVYVAGEYALCTTPDSERLLNGQRYYWRARAFDGLQWSLWTAPANFTVDDLAPEGFATSARYSTTDNFLVSWSAQDPPGGSGLDLLPYEVQVKDGLDGAWNDWIPATSETSARYFGQNGHTYCFRMRARDSAGNLQIYNSGTAGDTCASIDTDRPTATIAGLPPFEQSRTFDVRWAGDDGPSGSGVASYDVEVREEGGAFVPWLSSYPGDHSTYQAAEDRSLCFRAAARDRAGNVGDPSGEACTRIDTTPPACTVTVPALSTLSRETFPWTVACTDAETGVDAYEYSLGTSPGLADVLLPVRATRPPAVVTGLNLTNGATYYGNVRALNAAGAWSKWAASQGVRVAIPGPDAHIDYPAGVGTSTNVTLEFGATDALGYAIVSGELQYHRAAYRGGTLQTWEDWLTAALDPTTTSFFYDELVRGYAYEFRYRARNVVGSWGEYALGATLFVNHPPLAAAGQDRVANLSEPVSLDASQSIDYDGDRDALTFNWEVDDGRNFTGPLLTIAFDSAGTHTVTLTVSDGHEASTSTVTVYVPPEPPKQVLPGFEGVLVLAGLIAAAALYAGRRRPPAL